MRTLLSRASAATCVSFALLFVSVPSVSRMSTRPPSWPLSSPVAAATASKSAVPLCESIASPRSAASESSVTAENRERLTTLEPNASTAIWSLGGFWDTKPRAAAMASLNFVRIERDRSIAITTDFDDARLTAWYPVTGWPFSVSAGWTREPADETTVARIVGKCVASRPVTRMLADAAAGASRAASAARTTMSLIWRRRELTKSHRRTSRPAGRCSLQGRRRPA
jgi:hypothetical protein